MRSFSHAKSYRVSFRFTPKLSDQVVVITEESDFFTLVTVEINYTTQRNEKKGICKSVLIATVVAIRDVVKNGFHCSLYLKTKKFCKGKSV